jgi:prepilin-type processing-associated H-X9-DG protein
VLFVILGVAAVAGLCLVAILVALLIPAVMAAREAAARAESMNNLKQIGVALHNYHDAYKAFPAAFVPDENGNPRTSWRTSILPFLEQQTLFDQYDFSAPWDDPRNAAVRQTQIAYYQSPHAKNVGTNRTSYVVVTSQKEFANRQNRDNWTMFPGPDWIGFSDIYDGTTNTIAVVEIRNSNIEWSEPRDIDIDSLSTDPTAANSIDLAGGAVVLFADGSVRRLAPGTPLDTLKALLTMRDGRSVSY